jgi:hypothetical protein
MEACVDLADAASTEQALRELERRIDVVTRAPVVVAGGEWEYSATVGAGGATALAANTAVAVPFAQTVVTPAGITALSTTLYRIDAAGRWEFDVQLRNNGATMTFYGIIGPSATAAWAKNSTTNAASLSVPCAKYLPEGATFSVWAFATAASSILRENAGDSLPCLRAYRLGG